jgi:ubiquitin C
MEITIKTFANEGLFETGCKTLRVTRGHTIGQVKRIMENKERIPASEQMMMFAGKELEDGHTLGYYDIPDTGILTMDYSDQQIKIKTSSGKVLEWEVFVRVDTIASVKASLFGCQETSFEGLMFEGKKLEDGKRLIEYNICNGDTLVMY